MLGAANDKVERHGSLQHVARKGEDLGRSGTEGTGGGSASRRETELEADVERLSLCLVLIQQEPLWKASLLEQEA